MVMTDKIFEDRGYKRYRRAPLDPESVKYMYQKKFVDGASGKAKYFITARKWEFSVPNNPNYAGFEYEATLYAKNTHDAIGLTFHKSWTVDRVEACLETMWQTGMFEIDD